MRYNISAKFLAKRKVHALLDVLLLVLILDVHHGVQHVTEVLLCFKFISIKQLGRNVVSLNQKKGY